jgi:hypothetical protein
MHLFIVLLWSIMWHTFMSLPLDGFIMAITLLVSSPCLSLDLVRLRLNVTPLSMKKPRCNTRKPSHDFLASCALLLVLETQP